MRIGRVHIGDDVVWAVFDAERAVHLPDGPFEARRGEVVGDVRELALAAPVSPGKIVCVGLNYAAHVTERDATRKIPTEPVLFMKPVSALVGPGDPIQLAYRDHEVHHEAELVVVIGRPTFQVNPRSTAKHILGYTCGNDVSDRDLQKLDGQFVRAKGFDSYCPIGPWIETKVPPGDLMVESRVNGEIRQSQSTRAMLWDVPALVSFVSWVMTLDAGDVIMTGTPEGVGPLRPGDTCEVSINRLGTLTNPVTARKKVPRSVAALRRDGSAEGTGGRPDGLPERRTDA